MTKDNYDKEESYNTVIFQIYIHSQNGFRYWHMLQWPYFMEHMLRLYNITIFIVTN